MKKDAGFLANLEKKDKIIFIALSISIFAFLLFIALALTLPWGK